MEDKPKFFIFNIRKLIIPLIFLSFFSLGIAFEKWGGFDKLIPIVINFVRNHIVGDNVVLKSEKYFFSFNDYVKKNFYKKEITEQIVVHNQSLQESVLNLKQAYLDNYERFTDNDYYTLALLTRNYPPSLYSYYRIPLLGEGKWDKFYISEKTFKPLYANTFIRTDLNRPFVKVFIYKFDMDRLDIDFVPGKKDTDSPNFDGKMNPEQLKKVIWIFSGGYQYRHGNFGMKCNGEILLPPKEGIATLVIYNNKSFKIVEWSKEMANDKNIVSFRQNELPLIINGKSNYDIQNFWGLTPDDVDPIYTVRSGLGITNNNELVYAFGDNLSAETLAFAMIQAGVVTGMHLDMNKFNVHFVSVKRSEDGKLRTYNENDILSYYNNIYLNGSDRDYFLITEK